MHTNYSLELSQISKIYGSGATEVRAVDSVDLQVNPGEIVLIMGPSGSGKTTLLSIAGLLLRPTSGTIHVNGISTSILNENELARIRLESIGFVFQAYNLIASLTARENIQLVMNMAGARDHKAQERSQELLALLGLEERANHLPADLSGGQKQRVAIARALANDAQLILADEPTGNLDSKTGYEVMELLCCGLDREKGRSIVIVTHDHRLTDIADRVLWLEDGQLQENAVGMM
ncbi:MAG: ABC transporter ATP-binding protein [Anaerolineae bacterium]|nr:ABC transporter ATP-binding protein [Anaerolineae bacterium]MCA9886881.1 ABC transporter ATP-binding protein [Anaerolineae bacterium]MCA9891374.1 ABC transporter ATP-binding protein [Anaerolineae bacterium]